MRFLVGFRLRGSPSAIMVGGEAGVGKPWMVNSMRRALFLGIGSSRWSGHC
jgi:hypothetical protein